LRVHRGLKHWEEGEDLSLLEFKAIQYKRKGYVTATDEQLAKIRKVPKREFMRRGINQHTLEKICKREPVRASALAKVLNVLQQWELQQKNQTPETRYLSTKVIGEASKIIAEGRTESAKL
jgi:ribosomal protein L15